MVSFLAIIGLIVILWWISKGLKKGGQFLEDLGNHMEDRAASNTVTQFKHKKKKTEEKIKVMSGDGTDDKYMDKIRDEIDEITGGFNG